MRNARELLIFGVIFYVVCMAGAYSVATIIYVLRKDK